MNEPLDLHVQGRFGSPLRHLTVTDSTNAQALAWAAEGAPEGAVVVADEQRSGRGRHGRRWDAAPGKTLLMSVVLRPRLPPRRLGSLTLAAGVAVARAVDGLIGRRAELKWPNDVLIGDRKVAGILTEGTLVGSELRAAVVGIGINTEWTHEEMPVDLVGRATSLSIELEGGPVPRRADILTRVLAELEAAYDTVQIEPEAVLVDARARSSILGEAVRVEWIDGRKASGRAAAIRDDGALEVEIEGATNVIYAADIEHVRPART